MTIDRKSLVHRQQPMAHDVADAIDRLVVADAQGLPLALTLEAIIDELVHMAKIDDDGNVLTLPAAAHSAMWERFAHHLVKQGASTFQAGYKHYESRLKDHRNEDRPRRQVVPVTSFFFRVVYNSGARDCLDAMTDFEIKKSLPARPSELKDADGNLLAPDDDADRDRGLQRSGKTDGIVIFPPGYRCNLMTVWLRRTANVAIGVQGVTVDRLETASPRSTKIPHLREVTDDAQRAIAANVPREK